MNIEEGKASEKNIFSGNLNHYMGMCVRSCIVVNDGSVECMWSVYVWRESIDFHLQISRPFFTQNCMQKNIIHEAFHLNGKLKEHQS